MVAYGNAEYSLSKDDLETARLRNRLSPWDIGLLRGSGEQPEAGQLMIHWQCDRADTRAFLLKALCVGQVALMGAKDEQPSTDRRVVILGGRAVI